MPPATKCFLVFFRSKDLLFIFDCHTCFCVCQEAHILSIKSRLPSSFFWDARCFFWKGSQLQVFSQHLFQDFRQDASFLINMILVFLQETDMAIEFLTPISSFTATSPIDSPSISIFIEADSIIYLDVSLK